jgi:long-chain fatty acid transport protein
MLVACIALGGGYQLNEQGARAVGMGGAFVATASDASAVYYNPAGLAFQKGINVLIGGNLIIPATKFKSTVPAYEISTKSQVFTPVNLYDAYQINDDIVVGLGIFNPFGLGTEWPTPWSAKSDLQTWYFNPAVGYKITDQISLGLGVSYVYGSIKMSQPGQSIDGTGNGYNFNFGGIYKPMEGLSIGVSYRMKTNVKFSGDFKAVTPLGALSGTGELTLPMPGNFYVGAAYDVLPELTVEGDVQYIQWGVYKNLELKAPAPVGTIVQNKNWNDNITLRGGAEYKLNKETKLRGGLILDLSPQPPSKTEPSIPDGDRVDISVGGSYKINDNLSIDAAYMLVLFMERNAKGATPAGIYNSTAHIVSISLGYTL